MGKAIYNPEPIEIVLGQKVRDKVSGMIGIVTSRVVYLNGCVQCGVRAKMRKDGTVPESVYIDHDQLEIIGEGLMIKPKPTGGDMLDRPKF